MLRKSYPRIVSVCLIIAILLLLTGCGQSGTSQNGTAANENAGNGKKVALSIATAAMGGTYYPVGVGISEVLNSKLENIEARVEVTGGTVENPGLVNSGEADIGIANTDMAFFAYDGQEPFKEKMENVRGLFNGLAPGVVHYVVLDNSPVNVLSDLKGKKVAVGPQGNSTSLFLRKVLNELGIKWEEIEPSYLSFSDGIAALLDGKVDMAIVSAGLPSPAIKEIAASKKKFRILEFDDNFRKAFLEKHPYYIEYKIPGDMYDLSTDVNTVATQNMVIINADLDEELVYNITKAIFENIDIIYNSHPSAKNVTLEGAPETPIPLHPGAEKYYKEKGVLK